MIGWILKQGTATKQSSFIELSCKIMFLLDQLFWIDIKNGKTHPATNVNANSIRDDCIFSSEHSTYRQTITRMRIWHQGAGNSNRQFCCSVHLMQGALFNSFASKNIKWNAGLI